MKTEDLIPDEFFKQFKTGEELNNFLKSIQKRGIEKMLEGELDAHLDYDKHSLRKENNSRNGYSKKTIKIRYGDDQIRVPRDRDASYNGSISKVVFTQIISLIYTRRNWGQSQKLCLRK